MDTSWSLKCESHLIRNRDDLENSNLICLPETVLEEIKDIEPPYSFQLINPITGLKTYVGVKEFHLKQNPTATLPYWVYEYLGCTDDTILHVQLLGPILPGKQITIQPLEKSFFEIKDYDKCLEKLLINYPIVHKDQILRFNIFDKSYDVLIKDVEADLNKIDMLNDKSIDPFNIIRIINVDLNLAIDNKFLRKELEDKKKKIEEDLKKKREAFKRNNAFNRGINYNLPKKEEPKGKKLGTKLTRTLTRDEIRQQRLKAFKKRKKLKLQDNNINL